MQAPPVPMFAVAAKRGDETLPNPTKILGERGCEVFQSEPEADLVKDRLNSKYKGNIFAVFEVEVRVLRQCSK